MEETEVWDGTQNLGPISGYLPVISTVTPCRKHLDSEIEASLDEVASK